VALTAMVVSAVSPRGGVAGTQITVTGEGFGVAAGSVVFDPLGENSAATIVSWAPTEVVFNVPTMSLSDRFFDVLITTVGVTDSISFPFWYPTSSTAVDYQWPGKEAGSALLNVDDPRTFTAADFNRVLDRLNQGGGGSGDMVKAVYDTDDDGKVDAAEVTDAIDDNGTPRTWADIVALVTTALDPVSESFSVPSQGHTTFTISAIPTGAIHFSVNGVAYPEGFYFTRGGAGDRTLTWLNADFQLTITDRVDVLYFTEA